MENIPEIRDIHIPDGVSYFPLAYGWWLILGGIICAVILFKILVWSIKTSKKYYSLKKLKNISTEQPVIAAISMSEILRRICHVKYKDASVLYGDEWIDFLNNHSSYKLTDDVSKLLVYAPFINKDTSSYSRQDADELKKFCQHFIGENL